MSGAAFGVETATLVRNQSLVVLANGINIPYPYDNARLLDDIKDVEVSCALASLRPCEPGRGLSALTLIGR